MFCFIMWFKQYKDYPQEKPLIKEQVQSGKGIIGCEMHDLNGWGTEYSFVKVEKRDESSKTTPR